MKNATNQRFLYANLLAFMVLAFFVLSTYLIVQRQEALESDQQFKSSLNEFSFSVVDKIQQAVEKLLVVSSIMALSEEPSASDFQTYVHEYAGKDTGWLIVEWQPIIDAHALETFKRKHPNLDLWQPDANGHPIAAQSREQHVPVLFMVSVESTVNTTGLDLAWSEKRMASKLSARDEGKAQISPLFNVVLSQSANAKPAGFAITLPVYEKGIVPKTNAQRKNKIKGYLAGVYSLERMLENDLNVINKSLLRLEIKDIDTEETTFLYPEQVDEAKLKGSIQYKNNINLYGRTWEVTFKVAENVTQQQPFSIWKQLPYVLVIFGAVLLVLVNLLYRSNIKLTKTQKHLQNALVKVRQSEKYYEQLSRLDPLTGLFNRRTFFNKLDNELARIERYSHPLTILMIDLDEFKSINDTYGHPAGDRVLKQFALSCMSFSREIDIVARIGGEEFIFLLVDTDIQESVIIAERLRKAIKQSGFTCVTSEQPIHITISAGLASYVPGDSSESLMARADKALYLAKQAGRNRIEIG